MMWLLQVQRVLTRLQRSWQLRRGGGQIYVDARTSQYRDMWRAAAEAAGGTFTEISQSLWEVERDGQSTRILGHQVELDNPVTLDLAGRKALVHHLLAAHGLPVPDHLVFTLRELEEAYGFLERHPEGCAIKPTEGTSSGRGVTTHVMTRNDARRAALLASTLDSRILIEPMIAGESCRALVLNGQMIHAVRRRGIRVTGDGTSTVSQLVEARSDSNAHPPAPGDERDCRFTLGSQGLTPDSVPPAGRELLVTSVRNRDRQRVEVRTVYDEDVTAIVCPGLREATEAAARALKCELVGVDFITTDLTVPLDASGGRINEVNTTPGLHHHYDSATQEYPQAAIPILNALLQRADAS